MPDSEFPERDKKNYKLNLFYFNPDDKRTIVPKPNPNYGLTINFASKRSWWFTLPLLLLFAGIALLFCLT